MTTIAVLAATAASLLLHLPRYRPKGAFEKYFLRKVRRGQTEPFYEKLLMKWIGADKLKGAQ